MESIRFAGELPPVAVLGVALLATLLVMWIYLRETKSLAMPYSYLLPALRASAVALAILVLAGPVWHRRQVIGTLGHVIFAVDQSQSMATSDSADAGSNPQRMDRAVRMLTGDEQNTGLLSELSQTHLVDVISFSSESPTVLWTSRNGDAVPASFDLAAEGQRTDLAGPLAVMQSSLSAGDIDTVDDESGAGRAAIVLMTDGRHNGEGAPVDVAAEVESSGAAVHVIGIGSEDEPADIGIVNVIRPESVAADGRLAGNLSLKQFGLGAEEITLRIESGGETVWQKTVTTDGQPQQSFPFEFDVEPVVEEVSVDASRRVRRSSIVLDLRAVIDPIGGDTVSDNNAMPFRVAATTRDRRLLILDGSSRWEIRYIKNLFQRDPSWSIDTVMFGPGTDMRLVERGEQPGLLPNTRAAFARYDAVILGEVPVEQFSQADASRLQEFVTRGGGLIVIDGRYDRLRELTTSLLPELIPVQYASGPLSMTPRAISPTRMGEDHPVMNLWGDKAQLNQNWEALPAPSSALRVAAQEGAEVWANLVAEDGSQSPWLVTRLYGSGRVFYLSADQTWRWRYKIADQFHARFWNQLLAAVMQPPYSASDDYVALGTDKIEYEAGQSSTVRVRLQDTGGRPVADATVDALLVSGDQVVATVPLMVDDPARGTYQGQTPPLTPGRYDVRVRASGFDAAALQANTPIWVGSHDNVERRRVSLDQAALLQITEAGGGRYFHESSAGEILDSLRPLSSGTVVESDILIWQSFYWFWAVIVLLAIEWWMRKRAGLV